MKIREIILAEIRKNPGIHFRDLQRRLNLSTGTLSYNLYVLEKSGLIYSRYESGYRRYYTLDLVKKEEREIVGVLRMRTPRRILAYLLANPGCYQHEIALYLKVSQSTVSHYLKVLLGSGLIEEVREKNAKRYWIKKDKEYEIRELILRYKDSFLDKIIDSLVDIIMD